MAGAIQQNNTTVSALLRAIEEEKSKGLHKVNPADSPTGPVREASSGPLETPLLAESKGSERTIGVKPEAPVQDAQGTTPGRILFGGRGGPGDQALPNGVQSNADYASAVEAGNVQGVEAVGNGVYSKDPNVSTPTPAQATPAPKSQPSLQDYLSQGKTVDQYYAETGKQGELDAINKDPRKSINAQGNVSEIGKGGSSGPTVQDYLAQGKTVDQFYSENGRQAELDQIRKNPRLKFDSQGNVVDVTGASTGTPSIAQDISPNVNRGQVLGISQTLEPRKPEFIGPLGPNQFMSPDVSNQVSNLDQEINAIKQRIESLDAAEAARKEAIKPQVQENIKKLMEEAAKKRK